MVVQSSASRNRADSRARVIRRRSRAGLAGIFLFLSLGLIAWLLTWLLALAALAILALPGKVESLEVAEIHPSQANHALQILAMLVCRLLVTPGFVLFSEHPVGLAGAFDLGFPLLCPQPLQPHEPGHVVLGIGQCVTSLIAEFWTGRL